jgi:ankyrin repeat protein
MPRREPELLQSLADQLIAGKADPTGVDENKRTALVAGAATCPIGIRRALIAAGVPLNAGDKGGDTAMRRAIGAGRVGVVNLLIDGGVDPRKRTRFRHLAQHARGSRRGGAPRARSCDELEALTTQHRRIATAICYVALAGELATVGLL